MIEPDQGLMKRLLLGESLYPIFRVSPDSKAMLHRAIKMNLILLASCPQNLLRLVTLVGWEVLIHPCCRNGQWA